MSYETTEEVNERLPEWATCIDIEERRIDGTLVPKIRVKAYEAYPTLLAEYAEHYDKNSSDLPAQDEFDEPTAYALEVVAQTIKMDLWVALRTVDLFIRVKDPDQEFAQEKHSDGRGPKQATPETIDPDARREAVEHYRELRGVVPAAIRG